MTTLKQHSSITPVPINHGLYAALSAIQCAPLWPSRLPLPVQIKPPKPDREAYMRKTNDSNHCKHDAGGMSAEDHELAALRIRKNAKAQAKLIRQTKKAEEKRAALRERAMKALLDIATTGADCSAVDAAKAILEETR